MKTNTSELEDLSSLDGRGMETKTHLAMASVLKDLDPGSLRYRALRTAMDFKRSWVDLANQLTEIRDKSAYKEWGYRTLEAYAQHELHIKRETVQKLVRSFDFLSAHEKPTLEAWHSGDFEGTALPSYRALDVLAEARQNSYLSEPDYRNLRDQVFGADPSPTQIRKFVKDRAKEGATVPVENSATDKLRRCLTLAERLYGMLIEIDDMPENITKALEEAVGGLRKICDE